MNSNNEVTYCKKEFLTDSPDSGTSTVSSFYGNVTWGQGEAPENLSFLEVSSCHERARLHRTHDMTHEAWVNQLKRLSNHINEYLYFLETR